MKNHKSILSHASPFLCSNATILVLALSAVTNVNAGDDSTTAAYVDSIHKWGAWELDIEPAAGGLQQPPTQALNARDSRVTLRTNSIAALAPQRQGTVTPPTPVPTITPISPAIPVPIGGPGDGF